MIEGAKWKRWVFFYIPLSAFVFSLLFPFYWMAVTTVRPDSELYRPWMAPNYTPFWTTRPTAEHVLGLIQETLFTTWMGNTMFIAIVSTLISLFCGLLAGYALSRLKFPFAGSLGTGIFAFTLSWNEFIYALVFISSPTQKTVPVGVTSELIRGDVFYWGQLMAGALLGSIPVAFVYSFFVEHYVAGITGSVKG